MYLIFTFTITLSLLPSKITRFFHKVGIEGADAAIIIQRAIGFPSSTEFKSILKGNQLQKCPITVSDIDGSELIKN